MSITTVVAPESRSTDRRFSGDGVFGMGSPNLADLDAAVTAIDEIELLRRTVEAAELRAYARLYTVAANEHANQPVRSIGGRTLARDTVEGSIAYRSARADVATSLHLSEQAIERRREKAHELVTQYAATVETLEAGEIAVQHATVIAEAGRVIGKAEAGADANANAGVDAADTPEIQARRAEYEAIVLAKAREMSPNQLRPYARSIAERFTQESFDERHERAKKSSYVSVEPAEDGMARFHAYIPAEDALGIHSRLTAMAKHVQLTEAQEFDELRRQTKAAGEDPPVDTRRTRDEIRAALFTDLLGMDFTDPEVAQQLGDALEAGGGVPAIRGIVQVIVNEEHLGESYDPTNKRVPLPEFAGYGPCAIDTSRTFAGTTKSWTMVTVTPGTGDITEITSRVPSADQKRKLLVRDEHCRWPGCRAPGYRCDIDHTVAVSDGGPTSMGNLGFLCRNHHTLKHHGGWKVEQHPGAIYEWTSPTGRTTITRPASSVRFQVVEEPPEFEGIAPPESGPPPGPGPAPAPQADPELDSWDNQPF